MLEIETCFMFTDNFMVIFECVGYFICEYE